VTSTHGADPPRVVGGLDRLQFEIADRALHSQTPGAQCLQVGTAGNEHDLLPRPGQATAEVATDSPDTDDSNTHDTSR